MQSSTNMATLATGVVQPINESKLNTISQLDGQCSANGCSDGATDDSCCEGL